MKSQSIEQQLAVARIGIDNALAHPEIQPKLALIGFTKKKLLEGKSLLNNTVSLQKAFEDKYGEKYGATDTFYEDMDAAKALYRRHRKLAKVAYEKNRKQLTVLKLHLPVPNRIEKWLSHANTFYTVLAKDSSVIQQYGIFTEELAQAQSMTEALLAARNWQISAKGDAQHATKQRDKALAALKAWMKEFRLAARYALREDTQLLEVLGMVVPSTPSAQ